MSRLAVQRVFAMDEARFGLKVTHRRLWCPFGSRPPWIHEHQYHWFWLYAAVEGKVNGEDKQVIYPMRRVDCQSGALIRN